MWQPEEEVVVACSGYWLSGWWYTLVKSCKARGSCLRYLVLDIPRPSLKLSYLWPFSFIKELMKELLWLNSLLILGPLPPTTGISACLHPYWLFHCLMWWYHPELRIRPSNSFMWSVILMNVHSISQYPSVGTMSHSNDPTQLFWGEDFYFIF